MQMIISIAYGLADVCSNLSFYGDLLFTVARTLIVIMVTHLIIWSCSSELADDDETKEQDSQQGVENESALRAENDEEQRFGISICLARRRRIARLLAGVQWQQRGRRLRPRRD
ncbi:hypothetical protein PYW08_008614 [Mythimna loreyi]|uniref:Uncharacterized protein n=1 Tax=Mythimna loreyi TaxID=667449 RepID=A0ACC2QBN0_9NEOP|nr:hypothetical protein PYW08_008614 [Mythimna loreyi]